MREENVHRIKEVCNDKRLHCRVEQNTYGTLNFGLITFYSVSIDRVLFNFKRLKLRKWCSCRKQTGALAKHQTRTQPNHSSSKTEWEGRAGILRPLSVFVAESLAKASSNETRFREAGSFASSRVGAVDFHLRVFAGHEKEWALGLGAVAVAGHNEIGFLIDAADLCLGGREEECGRGDLESWEGDMFTSHVGG